MNKTEIRDAIVTAVLQLLGSKDSPARSTMLNLNSQSRWWLRKQLADAIDGVLDKVLILSHD